MKKIKYLIFLFALVTAVSCSEDKLDKTSVITDPIRTENDLDRWIFTNYIGIYNIDLKYRMEDIETDMNYNLVPVKFDKSIIMSQLVKFLCLEAYDEATGSTEFIRSYFPKIINLVGSAAYRNNGTMVLGTAEGGRKITLYYINSLKMDDIEFLNKYYFQTIHHEFVHILHQTKPYSADFKEIRGSDYVADNWNDYTQEDALKLGFITPYASNAVDEDFAEIMSMFLTLNPQEWNARLVAAGSSGRSKIEAKFDILQVYLRDSWEIDIYALRDIIGRRFVELDDHDFTHLN